MPPDVPKKGSESTAESEFGTGSKFGAEVAKLYGEGPEILVFLGKRGRKTILGHF